MGISGFKRLFSHLFTKRSLSELRGTTVLIDTLFIIFKTSIGIRNKGSDILNSKGESISHLHAIYSFALFLIEKGIHPVFVFDRKCTNFKKMTYDKRKNNKSKSENICDNVDDKTSYEYIKHFKRAFSINKHDLDECKYLLYTMGIPYVEAYQEADSQIAGICKYYDSKIGGVITDDADILVYGGHTILTEINLRDGTVNEINLYKIINYLKTFSEAFTQSSFIDLCVLLGSDYLDGIKGVTKESIFDTFIKSNLSIRETITNLAITNKLMISEKFIRDVENISSNYRNASIYDPSILDISLKSPDIINYIEFVTIKEIISRDEIKKSLEKINNNYNVYLVIKNHYRNDKYRSFSGYQYKHASKAVKKCPIFEHGIMIPV